MEILRVENLNFKYSLSDGSLKNIGFGLDEGEILCVCGPTGSGKSTLLRLLKRELSPRGQKSGIIRISGKKQEELSDFEAATNVGYVMQRPDMQIVTDKVWHELAFGLENIGVKQNEIRRRVCEIAGYFGMESWFEKSTDSLSGGQKQLLNLASVMVMQPAILVLDEPVSQLDPIAASDFMATVKKLCREFGISVIAAEQRLEDLIAISDKILALKNGEQVCFGPARECVAKLIHDPEFAAAMPAAAKLYEELGGGTPIIIKPCEEPEEATISVTVKNREEPGEEGIPLSAKPCEEPGGEGIPLSVSEGRIFLKKCIAEASADNVGRATLNFDLNGKGTADVGNESGSGGVRRAGSDLNGKGTADVGNESAPAGAGHRNGRGDEDALVFSEVYLRYSRAGKDVLTNLGFKVKKGEIFCLLGGNGAGKSTAVAAAAGLIKPYSGKIKVFGKNIRDYAGQELYRECVALLPQDVQTVFLKDEINGRHPYDLSGGEQQLAALDIVLATNPRLLLLDEPTKGLDAGLAAKLKTKLLGLAQNGVTIVIVTHDVEFAASVADRCAMLFNGEVVSCADAEEFFKGNYFYTTARNRIMRGIIQ